MPKITVSTTPQLLATSQHGNFGRPTRLTARIDPADTTSTVWLGRKSTVTVGGTNNATDGVPLLAGETFNDNNMIVGESWYIVASGNVSVYYDTNGG